MIETKEQALERWNKEVGHTTGFDYLNENSHVWEIGLWHGHWVSEIAKNYNPYITAFEPIRGWAYEGQVIFANNPKVHIYSFGLGAYGRIATMNIDSDATGEYCESGTKDKVTIFAVDDIPLSEPSPFNIDLMQCNCEGGEYEILPALIRSGLINRFDNLLIQFHNLNWAHPMARERIQNQLQKTHTQGLCVDWVFEYWKRK